MSLIHFLFFFPDLHFLFSFLIIFILWRKGIDINTSIPKTFHFRFWHNTGIPLSFGSYQIFRFYADVLRAEEHWTLCWYLERDAALLKKKKKKV